MSRHWNLGAWIACLAILFNALAPLVSDASEYRAGASAAVAMEVCTASGMEQAPDQGQLHKGMKHCGMKHCGLCVAHAASHGLPPPMTATFAPAAGRDVYPPLHYHSPRPLFPWSLAQPRAPPALA